MRRVLIEFRDADHHFVRQVSPESSTVTLRFNAVSTASIVVRGSDPVVSEVMQGGMRAVVWMVVVDGNSLVKTRLMEGRVGDPSGDGPFGTVTIPVSDDLGLLSGILAWPNPGKGVAAQTDEVAVYTGPSDTRALNVISANVSRLGLPWNVATPTGVGSSGSTQVRMDPVLDQVVDALTADRIRLTVARDDALARWKVGVSQGDEYTRPLTPSSGVVGSWQWTRQEAALTRVVVGGAGDGTDREFATVVDSALETTLGVVLEGFVDAHDAEVGENLTPYGEAALADAAVKAGMTATLRETTWFRFPSAYTLGTRLHLKFGALEFTDVVSQVKIVHSTSDGFVVVPTVGFADSDPTTRLTRFVSNVAASVRKLERR